MAHARLDGAALLASARASTSASIDDREQHVLGLDVLADAPGRALALDEPLDERAHPGADVLDPLVVLVADQ